MLDDRVVINNTYRFVFPILRLYGKEYERQMENLYKQGVFIDDMFVARPDDRDYLHVVVNIPYSLKRKEKKQLADTLKWFNDNVAHMVYILNVDKHSKKPWHIVMMLAIPQRYQGCVKLFVEGNTNLFSNKDVEYCFSARNKLNEGYFNYCKNIIAEKTKIKINLDEEVLNI